MSYSVQTWADNDPRYPVSADRMQHIESGLDAVANGGSLPSVAYRITTADGINVYAYDKTGTAIYTGTDAGAALTACLPAAASEGATIAFRNDGFAFPWASVPALPKGITNELLIVGNGATVQLSAGGPRFLDFNKTADYDTFQNIEISDLVIDCNSVGGNHHVVLGTYVAGSNATGTRVNFDRIALRRIRTINVPVDPTLTTIRRNISFLPNQAAANEGTQTAATNILVEDCDLSGGNAGVEVMGQGPSATGINVFIDNVVIRRCRHDMLSVQSANFASANFQVGSRGFGGRALIEDCWGQFSGDVGIEVDSMTHVVVRRCQIENNYGASFYFTNFNYPAIGRGSAPSSSNTTLKGQRILFERCRSIRTSTAPTQGFRWNQNLSVTLGSVLLRDCSFYRNTADFLSETGQALFSNAPANIVDISGFDVVLDGVNVGGGQGSTTLSLLSFQNGTVGLLRMRDVRIDFTGTNASASPQTLRGIDVGGSSFVSTLDVDGIMWKINLTGWVGGTFGMLLGNSTANLRGSVRRFTVLGATGLTSASDGILVGGSGSLTIGTNSYLVIEACDFALMPAGTEIAYGDTTNQNKVYASRNIFRGGDFPVIHKTREDLLRSGLGWFSETVSKHLLGSTRTLVCGSGTSTGTAHGEPIGLLAGDVVTNIVMSCANVGANVARFEVGLFDKLGNMLARSGDVKASLSANATIAFPLTSPFTVLASDIYYVVALGTCSSGTAAPQFSGPAGVASAAQFALGSNSLPSVISTSSTLSDLSGNLTFTNVSSQAIWFAVN